MMYDLFAKKFAVPWTILSALLMSILLYLLTGSLELVPRAYTASYTKNPTTGVVTLIEKMLDNKDQKDQQEIIKQEQQESIKVHDQKNDICEVDGRYPESIRQWCNLITRYADQNNLDPDLVAALIWQESGGNPDAYSKSGAVGLMQVMPRDGISSSFQCPNGPCFKDRPTISELKKPEFNISYGTSMLEELQLTHSNIRDALKAYGPMDVGYYYADKVLNLKATYGD
jgi:hypothetical protein